MSAETRLPAIVTSAGMPRSVHSDSIACPLQPLLRRFLNYIPVPFDNSLWKLSMTPKCTRILLIILLLSSTSPADDIRDRAVLRLAFDGDQPLADQAGQVADQAMLPNGGTLTPAAFVADQTGNSLFLEPDSKQYVSVATSDEIKRPDAVTVSGFFASLHPLSDNQFHGLFAVRNSNEGTPSNFGINFNPASDNFQLYVNPGSGYKVANYSVSKTIGFRKRVYLTASFDQGDAPGADADTDADDVRIRLFLNGKPVAPAKSDGGVIEGNSAWVLDTSLAACVSETPLTIGASFADGELTRMACDDFCLFAEALSDQDVAALFQEAAGQSAATLAAEKDATATSPSRPQMNRISPPALQRGQTGRITVTGSNLAGATFLIDAPGITVSDVENTSAGTAVFDVTVPTNLLPGRFLGRCVTPAGVSNPLLITFDSIPTSPQNTFTRENPATELPVAVSGVISGTEQKQVWFVGKAGQQIAVEVEARRSGSMLDPVVEIRNDSSGPLAVDWQQPALSGDSRTTVTLPADGLYIAELHDLQYKAPGGSSWRLIIGDLPPSGLSFPPVLGPGSTPLQTINGSATSAAVTIRNLNNQPEIEKGDPLLALPDLALVAGPVVTEPLDGTFSADPVDATFSSVTAPPLNVVGRISQPGQTDSLPIKVTAGQTLLLKTAAIDLGSSLRPRIRIFNGESQVAANDGQAGLEDPRLTYKVPEKVEQLQIRISDVDGNGSGDAIYHLAVSRTDRQAFELTAASGELQLPINGSVPLELSVVRKTDEFSYPGPILLNLESGSGLQVIPDEIPPSTDNQNVFVMITRSQAGVNNVASADSFRITGRAGTANDAATSQVTINVQGSPTGQLTLPRSSFVASPTDPVAAITVPADVPPILFRGMKARLAMEILPVTEAVPAFLRFDMLTTEPVRRSDPAKADSPPKPRVRLSPFQFTTTSTPRFELNVVVPEDTAVSSLDAVIGADPVPHPLAAASASRIWSAPLKFAITGALSSVVVVEGLEMSKGATNELQVQFERHPLFQQPVTVELEGLKDGFSAGSTELDGDATVANISINVPENASGKIDGVSVRIRTTAGESISSGTPVPITVK